MTIISSAQWVATILCLRTRALAENSSPRLVLFSHRYAFISGIQQAIHGFSCTAIRACDGTQPWRAPLMDSNVEVRLSSNSTSYLPAYIFRMDAQRTLPDAKSNSDTTQPSTSADQAYHVQQTTIQVSIPQIPIYTIPHPTQSLSQQHGQFQRPHTHSVPELRRPRANRVLHQPGACKPPGRDAT